MRITARSWSESEEAFLRSAIESGNRPKEIAKHLKRTEKSVECHMRRLRIEVKDTGKVKAKNFDLADVKCPYFCRFYRGKSIKCEGLGKAEGGYLVNSFGSENEWVNYVNLYCNTDWDVCPLAVILTKKE